MVKEPIRNPSGIRAFHDTTSRVGHREPRQLAWRDPHFTTCPRLAIPQREGGAERCRAIAKRDDPPRLAKRPQSTREVGSWAQISQSSTSARW
jgi:hypothetical protein